MKISISLTLILLIAGCINNPEEIIENSASWLIKINNNYCAFDQGNNTMLFPIDSIVLTDLVELSNTPKSIMTIFTSMILWLVMVKISILIILT
jgi:hypothetical protein